MEHNIISERELASKRLYCSKELEKIEKVLTVFADYIRSAHHFDILWSNKVGYIFLNDITEPESFDAVPSRIERADELCSRLLYEVGVDVMLEIGRTVNISAANALEHQLVIERLKPYLEQLPEYQSLVETVFDGPTI